MAGRFLFGEWRFVGRLMRKKGLLLVFVIVLQAGLLISLAIILSITKVTDTMPGRAIFRLGGDAAEITFSPDHDRAAAVADVDEMILVLSIPGRPDGLSLPVQLVQAKEDEITLRAHGNGDARAALSKGPIPALLVYRSRTLLSAIIQDRKVGRAILDRF